VKGSAASKNFAPCIIFLTALTVRLIVRWLIPVDWNWDSYHHWRELKLYACFYFDPFAQILLKS